MTWKFESFLWCIWVCFSFSHFQFLCSYFKPLANCVKYLIQASMTKDLTCTSWLHFIHFAYGICPLVYAALSIGSCKHVFSHWYTHIDVPKFLKLLVFPVPDVVCIVLPTLLKRCWKECQHKALPTYDTIMEWFSQRLIDKG